MGKRRCHRLAQACDRVAQELESVCAKEAEICSRLKVVEQVLSDILVASRSDQQAVIDLGGSNLTKVGFLLSSLVSTDRLRDVVIGPEEGDKLMISLLAPKDLFMPTSSAVEKVFPIGLEFSCLGDLVAAKGVKPASDFSRARLLMECVASSPVYTRRGEWRLADFDGYELPTSLTEFIDEIYRHGQQLVWDLYLVECYLKDSKRGVSGIFPKELKENGRISKFSHVEDSKWLLGNSNGTIEVRVWCEEGRFRFEFSEFSRREGGGKERVRATPIVKKFGELQGVEDGNVGQALSDFAEDIRKHFSPSYNLIMFSVLMETFAVCKNLLVSFLFSDDLLLVLLHPALRR